MNYYPYDIFISHNRADKDFARSLATQLIATDYNGRPLRPWLDEQFLDPGELGSDEELTSALDRSRCFGLVVSPEALQSPWVKFEIDHFRKTRGTESIVLIFRSGELPENLKTLQSFDFSQESHQGKSLKGLLAVLCPTAPITKNEVAEKIQTRFEDVWRKNPGGLDAEPTKERDALFDELIAFDIEDSATEGIAIDSFLVAAQLISEIDPFNDRLYNQKMILGECLAAARYRSRAYKQVSDLYLNMAREADSSLLLFVVARAYSKLADYGLHYVDVTILLQLADQLDKKSHLSNEERTLGMMLGRALGKIRNTDEGQAVISTMAQSGRQSKLAAIGAIGFTYNHSEPAYFISAFLEIDKMRPEGEQQHFIGSPSSSMLCLLREAVTFKDPEIDHAVTNAQFDLQRAYPGIELIYYTSWAGWKNKMEPLYKYNFPFVGKLVSATLSNMVQLGEHVNGTHVVCLTEPRVVDGLFNYAGALIITEQDADSIQCKRLRSRHIPFCIVSERDMKRLKEGFCLAVSQGSLILYQPRS